MNGPSPVGSEFVAGEHAVDYLRWLQGNMLLSDRLEGRWRGFEPFATPAGRAMQHLRTSS
jgi:hypothetical protein